MRRILIAFATITSVLLGTAGMAMAEDDLWVSPDARHTGGDVTASTSVKPDGTVGADANLNQGAFGANSYSNVDVLTTQPPGSVPVDTDVSVGGTAVNEAGDIGAHLSIEGTFNGDSRNTAVGATAGADAKARFHRHAN